MEYIFACDLDGTLLDDKANLLDETIEYIKNLDKDKYKFVITTGRPYLSMIGYYKALNLDTYVICNSGTSIMLPETNFKSIDHPIDKEIYKAIFKEAKSILDSAIYTIDYKCYMYKYMENAEFLKHVTRGAELIMGDLDKICDISPNGGLFMVKKGHESEFEKIIDKYPEVRVRCWGNFYGNDYYEIYNSKFNKSTSLKDLLALYNTDFNHLVCFGDSVNDIEMISLPSIGVCMKNGKEQLKKCADYITEYDNNHNGVIRFIDEFIKKTSSR